MPATLSSVLAATLVEIPDELVEDPSDALRGLEVQPVPNAGEQLGSNVRCERADELNLLIGEQSAALRIATKKK
jgi:hypothetical protein